MEASHRSYHSMLKTSSSWNPIDKGVENSMQGSICMKMPPPNQIWDSSLLKQVLRTCIPNDYISIKMILDNYDDLANLREHV
jgi:hypothetical protein